MGNLRSVAKALEHAAPGWTVTVTGEPEVVLAAQRVVFPGVGAVGDCMAELRRRGLDQALREAVRAGRPLLGICLGLQALFQRSEESGGVEGLGLLPGVVRAFPQPLRDPESGRRLKVPHMGWNQVWPTRSHPLWEGIAPGERFYFVHSYYAQPAEEADVAATCVYGLRFPCAVARGSLFAVQFHPEKSQRAGLRLLASFAEWEPA
ncbi:MAG: imidazole glycerol phosphate synthase subunit HisH [Gammaproteobacteria bacterium]|nr:MAG: imidazole glycerol phosphate synthase subunit HisH [Gammaproteobacteria bacterium]